VPRPANPSAAPWPTSSGGAPWPVATPLAAGGDAPGSPGAPTAQQIFELAAAEEGHDAAHAIALYRGLAAGDGPWAANALFAQASLEQARGHGGEARRLLETYLRRFPNGRNAGDARALLDRRP
jgi:hypothetical protein